MTTTSKVLLQGKLLEDAATTQYTSTLVRSVIDLATLCNVTALPATVDINLVPNGGASSDATLVHKALSVNGGETVLVEGLLGARMEPGDFLETIASDAAALALRLSGRVISG